jgi:hypothetical protein
MSLGDWGVPVVQRLAFFDQLVELDRVVLQRGRDSALDLAVDVFEVFDAQPSLRLEQLLGEVRLEVLVSRGYRGFLEVLLELFFDLDPLVLVRAFEEAEQLDARPQHLGLDHAVHELLEDLSPLVQVLFLEAPLRLVGHRRDLLRRGYEYGRVLSDEDVAQPVEVAEPALHLVLERHGVHFVHRVLLREEALVDDLGTGEARLLSDLDLQAHLAVQLVEFRFFAGHRIVCKILVMRAYVHRGPLFVGLQQYFLRDLLALVVHRQLVVLLRLGGGLAAALRLQARLFGLCLGRPVLFGVLQARDCCERFRRLVSAQVLGFVVEPGLRRGVLPGGRLLVVFDRFFERQDAPVVDVFASVTPRVPSGLLSDRNSTKRLGS